MDVVAQKSSNTPVCELLELFTKKLFESVQGKEQPKKTAPLRSSDLHFMNVQSSIVREPDEQHIAPPELLPVHSQSLKSVWVNE